MAEVLGVLVEVLTDHHFSLDIHNTVDLVMAYLIGTQEMVVLEDLVGMVEMVETGERVVIPEQMVVPEQTEHHLLVVYF